MLYIHVSLAKLYSVDAVNSRIYSYIGWPPGHRPPDIYHSVAEGQKGGLPKTAAHLHYTSGQMMHMMQHGVELFKPLFVNSMRNAPTGNPKQRAARVEAQHAWNSFESLCKWFELLLRPSFTFSSILNLDRAYYDYQV